MGAVTTGSSFSSFNNWTFKNTKNYDYDHSFTTLTLTSDEDGSKSKFFFVAIDNIIPHKDKNGQVVGHGVTVTPITKDNYQDEKFSKTNRLAYILLCQNQCSLFCDSKVKQQIDHARFVSIAYPDVNVTFAQRGDVGDTVGISFKTKSAKVIVDTYKTVIGMLPKKEKV